MKEMTFASASHLAALIRERKISCLELLDTRTERLNGRLNGAMHKFLVCWAGVDIYRMPVAHLKDKFETRQTIPCLSMLEHIFGRLLLEQSLRR
jgi:hypothetical protein